MFENIPLTLAQDDVQPAAPDGISAPATEGGSTGATGSTEQQPLGSQDGSSPEGAPQGPGGTFMLILLGGFVFIILMSMRTNAKEKKKRQELINSLQKGSKVQTVGGIIGTVVELRDSEVILKVDENSNTRIKFKRSAIQSLVDDESTKE